MDDNAPYILAIAQEGSISKAAQKMHLSQPALSQRLKNLESQLGVLLFERTRTPLAPTYACQIYLEWAKKAIEREDLMKREVSAIANNVTRRLQIGTSVPRANGLLPDIIEKFYEVREGCVVSLLDAGVPARHDHLLATSEIDFALLTPVRPEPSLFVGEPLCDERMLLLAPADWALPIERMESMLPVVKASTIATLPFIMPPRHLKHAWIIHSMMDAAGVRPKVVFHSCSNEVTMEMIKRGLGVSIAPNTFVFSQKTDHVSLYAIDEASSLSQLYYNRKPGRSPSEDEQVFLRITKKWIKGHDLSPSRESLTRIETQSG